MKAKLLEWDSIFFKKKVGEVAFLKDEILEDMAGFDLLYVRQTDDEPFEIDYFKQTYAETKVVFSKTLSKNNEPIDNFIFSVFDIDICKEQIYNLAFESGKFSRFKLDENFKAHEFEELYKIWVDNSLNKKFADNILVFKQNDTILGFVTYKIFENYATIGLIATALKMQGRGIGSKLIQAVENKINNVMVNELRIATQLQNIQACDFYTKLGYQIIEKLIIKHYWKI